MRSRDMRSEKVPAPRKDCDFCCCLSCSSSSTFTAPCLRERGYERDITCCSDCSLFSSLKDIFCKALCSGLLTWRTRYQLATVNNMGKREQCSSIANS